MDASPQDGIQVDNRAFWSRSKSDLSITLNGAFSAPTTKTQFVFHFNFPHTSQRLFCCMEMNASHLSWQSICSTTMFLFKLFAKNTYYPTLSRRVRGYNEFILTLKCWTRSFKTFWDDRSGCIQSERIQVFKMLELSLVEHTSLHLQKIAAALLF